MCVNTCVPEDLEMQNIMMATHTFCWSPFDFVASSPCDPIVATAALLCPMQHAD